jgi:hypothetical protein
MPGMDHQPMNMVMMLYNQALPAGKSQDLTYLTDIAREYERMINERYQWKSRNRPPLDNVILNLSQSQPCRSGENIVT